MKRETHFKVSLLGLVLVLLAWPAVAESASLAKVEVDGARITFQPQIPYSQVRVIVSGPEGFELFETFDSTATPSVDLPGVDGFYKYELRFAPVVDAETRAALAAAREAGVEAAVELKGVSLETTVQSGSFSLAGGSLVPETRELDEKVVLTNGDGVIRNSLCVGLDCPDAPVFSDSTILLMENNTRIKFGDTSNAPFPNNDWEIEANSSLSGGANYLGFNDCGTADNDGGCADDLVFAVESGARASALYVESDGDIGIGTNNPVVDVHVVTGNTPTLRLEQDGSSGFTPQTWDVAGNETNFFIRDVTGGSTLPLRIRPGAPTSSIDIAASGNVGIGTASPGEAMHVARSAAAQTFLKIENTNAAAQFAGVSMQNSAAAQPWDMSVNLAGQFRISLQGSGVNEILVDDATGDVTIARDLTVNGTFSNPSSRTLKTGIQPVDRAEVLQRLASLPINEWSYTADSAGRRHVGPFTEDFAEAFGLGTKGKNIIPLDVQGVTIAALQGLYETVQAKDAAIAARDAQIRTLEQRLAALEEVVTRLAGDSQ